MVLSVVADLNLDILTVTETKCHCRAFWEWLRSTTGWRILGVSRTARVDADGRARPAQGGVAVFNCRPDRLSLAPIASDQRGLYVAEVRATGGRGVGDFAPFAVAVAYIPPRGSPWEDDSAGIYEAISTAARGAMDTYGRGGLVITGDFNARIGAGPLPAPLSHHYHHSEDPTASNRSELFKLLYTHGLLPAAGRCAEKPAFTTSRAVGGGSGAACVDYVLTDGKTYAEPLEALPWGCFPASGTHRPVAVHFRPPPAVGIGDGRELNHPPPQRGPRWRRAPYSDPLWGDVTRRLLGEMAARRLALAALPALTPEGAAAAAFATLDAVVRNALDATLAAPAARPLSSLPEAAGSVAGRTARARGLRSYRLPSRVVALLSQARAALRLAHASPTPAHREEARCSQRAASHALRDVHRQRRDEEIARLHRLRATDAKKFFQRVGVLASEGEEIEAGDPRFVPSEPDHPPAMERLLAKFAEAFGGLPPTPPALLPGGEHWLNYVTRADPAASASLGRPITGAEIYNVLMPVTRGARPLRCPATGEVENQCAICQDFNRTRSQWRGHNDLDHPAPRHAPTANTAAAAGSDYGLHHLRFPHCNDDPALTRLFRLELCEDIARALNLAWEAGNLPPSALSSWATSIRKAAAARGGARPNYASPEARRFVVVGETLAKILELALAARFTHWSIRYNIVSPSSQGAFLPLADSAAHVFALRELLLQRARAGYSTYVLYCDIADAYGSVNLAALCAQLSTMGVPGRLVTFLQRWGESRNASLRVNGATSPPTPMTRGVGIGCCHSPILWNLFISSLERFLASMGVGIEVAPGGGSFSLFLFADDVAVPSSNFDRLRAAVLKCEEWATAWGLRFRVGPTKTAFSVFFSPAALRRGEHRGALPDLVMHSGEVVPRVASYLYLGCPFNEDFSEGGLLTRALAKLRALLARYFAHGSVLGACDAVTTRQIYKVLCLGSVGYLLAMIPPTPGNIEALDSALRQAGRRFLGLPPAAPNALVLPTAGLPSALYLFAAARARLFLSLQHTPYRNSPAARIFRASAAAPIIVRPQGGVAPPWYGVTLAFFGAWLQRGVQVPVAADRAGVAAAAANFARRVCAAAARMDAPADADPGMASSARAPLDARPTHAVAAVALGYSYPQGLLGRVCKPSPMSYSGIAGSGAALSLTTGRVPAIGTRGMAMLRLGAMALRRGPPLGPTAWAVAEGAPPAAYREAALGRPCPLCAAGAVATPYHVLCECSHAAVLAARAACTSALPSFLTSLIRVVARSARRYDAGGLVASAAESAVAALTRPPLPPSTFILFRLLLAAPWHADCVAPGAPLESALGRLFDAAVIPNQSIHGIYNMWVPWAARQCQRLLDAWSGLVDEAEAP